MTWASRDTPANRPTHGEARQSPQEPARSGNPQDPAGSSPAPCAGGKGVRLRVTQYGYPNDECGDTLTRLGWGAWGNRLRPRSCALSVSAQKLLGAEPFDQLKIRWPNGDVEYRFFDDRAPQQGDPSKKFYSKEPERIDLYQPTGFDHSLPDYVWVELA